ncbi:hypothetical protein [Arenimonas composti]|uniref:Nucleotide exchange factor GrpE n=1 Tax=Arenimonas composti TR7-09 = DSM 18010 TaxID=1121013 RepID=A0A091BDA9_9GAMM|nr:hypothetical protein [Arenimonas composti]KFN50668.1 hypothetical protein P873_05770 [Arenimonas composti TR7-09 = DSM 18010]
MTQPPAAVTPAVVDLAVDAWKLARLFERVVARLDAGEQGRYVNQARFLLRRIDATLEAAGARLVSIEGQVFEPGQAATPLNLADFDADTPLVVAQMLEPIVMGREGVLRMGTMLLQPRPQGASP